MEKGGSGITVSHTKPTATEQKNKNINVFMMNTEIAKPIVGSIS